MNTVFQLLAYAIVAVNVCLVVWLAALSVRAVLAERRDRNRREPHIRLTDVDIREIVRTGVYPSPHATEATRA